jgi:hypothetical protein
MSSFSLPLDRCAIAIEFGGDLPFGGVDDLREEKKSVISEWNKKKTFSSQKNVSLISRKLFFYSNKYIFV